MDIVRIMTSYNVDNIIIKIRINAQHVISFVLHAHHLHYVRLVLITTLCIIINAYHLAQLVFQFYLEMT